MMDTVSFEKELKALRAVSIAPRDPQVYVSEKGRIYGSLSLCIIASRRTSKQNFAKLIGLTS